MSSSFGTNPLASNPLGVRRIGRTYSSGHLMLIGGIDVLAGLVALVWPG